jgi:DNA-binding CsgD family transcriptional regulator
MDALDVVQSFIEECERATALEELARAFKRAIECFGWQYFACCSHVDPLQPRRAVMLCNYPRPWIETYSHHKLHKIDPVFARAETSSLPFSWELSSFLHGATNDQRRILSEARHFGIYRGYTVPLHSPRSPVPIRASCTVIPEPGRAHRHGPLAVQLMCGYLFEAASRLTIAAQTKQRPRLSQRQRQCLELAAQGKTDWEIGAILGISEHTVHTHIEAAKRHLNVTSRQTAVTCSLAWGLIQFGDICLSTVRPH